MDEIEALRKKLANCKKARAEAEEKLKDWKRLTMGEARRHAVKLSEDLSEAISAQAEAERKLDLMRERFKTMSLAIDDAVPVSKPFEELEDKVDRLIAFHVEDQHSIYLLKEQLARRG